MENRTDRQTLHMLIPVLNRVGLLLILLAMVILLAGCPGYSVPPPQKNAAQPSIVNITLTGPSFSAGCPGKFTGTLVHDSDPLGNYGFGWTGPVNGSMRPLYAFNGLIGYVYGYKTDIAGVTAACSNLSLQIKGLPDGIFVFNSSSIVGFGGITDIFVQYYYKGSATVTVSEGQTVNATIVLSALQGSTGSMEFRSTVNSQPTPTACPADALVSFVSNTQPGDVQLVVPDVSCTGGQVTFQDVLVGVYTFDVIMSGGAITP